MRKRPIYNLLVAFLITISCIMNHTLFAQTPGAMLSLGLSIPANEDLDYIFDGGGEASVAFALRVFDDRLIILPTVKFSIFQKSYGNDDTYKELLKTWKFGGEVMYDIIYIKDVTLAPFIGIFTNRTKNTFSYVTEVYFDGTTSSEETDEFLNGIGVSYVLGIENRFNKFGLRIYYEWYDCKIDLGSNFEDVLNPLGGFEQIKSSLNMSTFNIAVSYHLF